MSRQERINYMLSGLPPGTVWADKGEPTAAEMRMLRWQLTPAEKKVVDFVMSHQADEFRNMTPEQLAKRSEKIRKQLGEDAMVRISVDPLLFDE